MDPSMAGQFERERGLIREAPLKAGGGPTRAFYMCQDGVSKRSHEVRRGGRKDTEGTGKMRGWK